MGTKVTLSDNKSISIQDVCIGDEVLTYDLSKSKLECNRVQDVLKYLVNELSVITLSDCNEIICTPSHPIYVTNRQKFCCVEPSSFNPKVEKLHIGDRLIN